jgi:hypothetical protein
VVKAKKALGYKPANQLPMAGDQLRRLLHTHSVTIVPSPKVTVREKFVEMMLWGIAHEPSIHYREARPIPEGLPIHTYPFVTDCSGWLTLMAKWAGAPDPNGNGFSGEGYTGTMIEHCRHITKEMLRPGDLIVFGAYPGHHVVGVIEPGDDPVVGSHGQEAGPIRTTESDELKYQPHTGIYYLKFI